MNKGRPKSPRCPECGKALYRTLEAGRKRNTDFYIYCRNAECNVYGDIRKSGYEDFAEKGNFRISPKKAVKTDEKNDSIKGTRERRKSKRKAVPLTLPKDPKETYGLCERCGRKKIECQCGEEPEAIKVVREKLKKTIIGSDVKRVTALSVVMMLQGLGEYDMANVLLDKYNLLSLGVKQRNHDEIA
jgi:hypothetical protein